jgi:hypothetical protein
LSAPHKYCYFLKADEAFSSQNVTLVKDLKTKEKLQVIEILASRRDLNPCLRRERPRPSRLYKNLEGAGGAARPRKPSKNRVQLHDCYMIRPGILRGMSQSAATKGYACCVWRFASAALRSAAILSASPNMTLYWKSFLFSIPRNECQG